MQIPLEDHFDDIIGKAQRGFQLNDELLANKAGVSIDELGRVQSGHVLEPVIAKVASALSLGVNTLLASANKSWYPQARDVEGLASFNTPFEDMHVNAHVVWDSEAGEAAVFDTGASAAPLLDFLRQRRLKVAHILLTHTHRDHVADLKRLRSETGAMVHVSKEESLPGAEPFEAGRSFTVGRLRVETRPTSGHSAGGVTYVISGLSEPVAVVGDALFAGSIGGGLVSYVDALANNRRHILSLPAGTVLCPGHGPLTTVGEEKQHNPFFPEFQKS